MNWRSTSPCGQGRTRPSAPPPRRGGFVGPRVFLAVGVHRASGSLNSCGQRTPRQDSSTRYSIWSIVMLPIRRARRDWLHNGLRRKKLRYPAKLLTVPDASQANRRTVYASEGNICFFLSCKSRLPSVDEWVDVLAASTPLVGAANALCYPARKASRASRSTSRALGLADVGDFAAHRAECVKERARQGGSISAGHR